MDMMDARDMRRDVTVEVAQVPGAVHFIVVGTRHAVVDVTDEGALAGVDVRGLGRALRLDPAFGPQGANVDFSSIDSGGKIHLRTYEKGVEDETLACGTGSVAAAVLYAHQGRGGSPRTVVQRSGEELFVTFALRPDGAGDVQPWMSLPAPKPATITVASSMMRAWSSSQSREKRSVESASTVISIFSPTVVSASSGISCSFAI